MVSVAEQVARRTEQHNHGISDDMK
jgi:hypothetical protein